MDERTADALRELVEDMAQALQLAMKNGEALILFLEDMLSSLESWAARHNVTLDATALHSNHPHPLHLCSQTRSRPRLQHLDAKQAFVHTESEAEHLQKGVASALCSAPVLSGSAHDLLSVGIFCFDTECERARMQAVDKRHDMAMYGSVYDEGQAQMQVVQARGHAQTQKDMLHCEKRAKTMSAGSVMQCVKEERCEHESMAFLGGAGASHIDLHTDIAVTCPNVAPEIVHSSLHTDLIGMHAYNMAP